jgi:hypothetical protein
MGESKRRRETDPNYGVIPKVQNKKGLVISSPMSIDLVGLDSSLRGSLDAQELRSWLLYWDELVWPASNLIRAGGGNDEEFLVNAKILTRPVSYVSSGTFEQIIINTHINCFLDLDKKEPGVWALAQGEKSLLLNHPSGQFVENEGITLELLRALPTPAEDVPLNEILEFKERRKDELLAFRAYTDKLVQEIQKSPEPTDEMKRVLKDVDAACAALLKVGHQWQFPVTFADFKCSFNFNLFKTGGQAAMGYTAASTLGLGLPVATGVAALSGLVSTIDIKKDFLGFRSIRKDQSPFQYCVNAHRELV